MTNDPIGDMLSRIRNAHAREMKQIEMPSNKTLESIAKILEEEGFINSHKNEDRKDKGSQKTLIIDLKYVNNEPAIKHLERVSKPGLRIYSGYKDVPKVKGGLGISIISTSRGLMTDKLAKSEKLGGEILAKIW